MDRAESYDKTHHDNGIYRKKVKDTFEYYYISTNKKVNKNDIERIKKLRIPPAWENVWIAKDPKSKIQVIGIDVSGKKQYLYNQEHIKQAEEEKFLRLEKFAKSMPKLEQALEIHKKLPSYHIDKVIALMLELVKRLHIRVGKEQYAKQNKSYGISSLKKTHVKVNSDTVKFSFKAKSRQNVSYTIVDRTIKNHIIELLKLKGEKLFQYVDPDNGKIKPIRDYDLNAYIQEFMGKFSVKDFRTYAANYHFIESLLNETKKHVPKDNKTIKKNIVNAIETTAFYLRHTKSISKKSYIMNFAVQTYIDDPEFFIRRRNKDPNKVLLELLKLRK
jgi:DNA topoisomerase-1